MKKTEKTIKSVIAISAFFTAAAVTIIAILKNRKV